MAEIISKTRGIQLRNIGHIVATAPHAHEEVLEGIDDHEVDIEHGIAPVEQKLRLRTARAERVRHAIALVGGMRIVGIAYTGRGGRTVLFRVRMRVSLRVGLRSAGGILSKVVDTRLGKLRVEGHGRIVGGRVGRGGGTGLVRLGTGRLAARLVDARRVNRLLDIGSDERVELTLRAQIQLIEVIHLLAHGST